VTLPSNNCETAVVMAVGERGVVMAVGERAVVIVIPKDC